MLGPDLGPSSGSPAPHFACGEVEDQRGTMPSQDRTVPRWVSQGAITHIIGFPTGSLLVVSSFVHTPGTQCDEER